MGFLFALAAAAVNTLCWYTLADSNPPALAIEENR
jgi:hypothetical protein